MSESEGERPRSRAELQAVGAAVKPAREAEAVKVEFVDASGSDFAVVLRRPTAADLVADLLDALSAGDDRARAAERTREAQLLLQALIDPPGRRARWVARKLGVGDSAVSLWRRGKAVPTQDRLEQLRELVKATARPG